MTMTYKILKYFSFCDKISSCLFARDHSFNTYAKFSDKLTFPTLRYAQARTYQINDSQALVERFQTIKIVKIFFGNLDSRISRFYRKRIISRKILVSGWGLPFWKLRNILIIIGRLHPQHGRLIMISYNGKFSHENCS